MRNTVLWLSRIVALSLCQQVFAAPSDTALVAASAVSAAPAATEVMQVTAESSVPGVSSPAGVVTEQATQVLRGDATESAASAPAATMGIPAQELVTVPDHVAPATASPANVSAKPKAVVSEADVMNLAKKRGCFECHALDQKTVGPAWKDVAAKYRGDAGAQARLVTKILEGGGGVWGKKAMSAQTHTSKAERTVLVRFILNLK